MWFRRESAKPNNAFNKFRYTITVESKVFGIYLCCISRLTMLVCIMIIGADDIAQRVFKRGRTVLGRIINHRKHLRSPFVTVGCEDELAFRGMMAPGEHDLGLEQGEW